MVAVNQFIEPAVVMERRRGSSRRVDARAVKPAQKVACPGLVTTDAQGQVQRIAAGDAVESTMYDSSSCDTLCLSQTGRTVVPVSTVLMVPP